MMNKLKSNKGSSFIYVLIVVLILTILTASLITATVTNYQLGLLKGGRNTSFYINDGAIEEALAEVEELSHRAEVYASAIIHPENGEVEFLNTTKWIAFDRWLIRHMELSEDHDDYLSAEEASAYYEKALRKEFTKQYLLKLLDNAEVKELDDYTLLDDKDKFVEGNNFTISLSGNKVLSDEDITRLETVTFTPENFIDFEDVEKPTLKVTSDYSSAEKAISLTIQSNGAYSIYNKQIEVVLTMIPPTYDYTTVTTAKRKELKKNDILENALTATQDIIVTGGNVITVGDVYAKGTFPEKSRILSHQKGGVIIGYKPMVMDFLDPTVSSDNKESIQQLMTHIIGKGNLSVKGHVKSGTSVKLQSDESSVSVDSLDPDIARNIIADSFIVMTDSKKTKTNINGHLLLLDDLFVNSSETSIKVGGEGNEFGNLITFFDGSGHSELAGPSTPDLSSSIRVRGDLTNVEIIANQVFIPGVAYIDMYRDTGTGRKYFQTGESMTAENNFRFYQMQLDDQELRTKEFVYLDKDGEELTAFEYLKEKENESDPDEIEDSVKYKVDHYLTIVRDAVEDGDVDIIAPRDKAIVKTQDISAQEFLDENYTLGVILANDKVFNPAGMSMSSLQFDDVYRYQYSALADINMNLLGIRKYTKDKNILAIDEGDSTSHMETFVDYSKNLNLYDGKQLLVVNDVDTDDVYINYPSGFEPPDSSIHYNNITDLTAIIATRGNIFIYNDNLSSPLNISGTLISDQTIVLYGPGEKNIERTDETVYRAIAENDLLVEAFHVKEGKRLVTLYTDGGVEPKDEDRIFDDLTRNYTFNLDLDIIDGGESIDFNILTNPQLDGSSKEESVKGYVVDYWREF